MEVTLFAPPVAGSLVTITGEVLDSKGHPLSGGTVNVGVTLDEYVVPSPMSEVPIMDSGKFELIWIPAGQEIYMLAASADRTMASVFSYAVPPDPENLEQIHLTLEPTWSVEMPLNADDGSTLAGDRVRVTPLLPGKTDVNWGADTYVEIGEDGVFRMDGVIRGLEYYLWVSAGGNPLGDRGRLRRTLILAE